MNICEVGAYVLNPLAMLTFKTLNVKKYFNQSCATAKVIKVLSFSDKVLILSEMSLPIYLP